MTSENLLYDTSYPNLVLCDNLKGWDGEAGGREVQERGKICIPMAEELMLLNCCVGEDS